MSSRNSRVVVLSLLAVLLLALPLLGSILGDLLGATSIGTVEPTRISGGVVTNAPSPTSTRTGTASVTPTRTATASATATPSSTATLMPSQTPFPTVTLTPSQTPTPTARPQVYLLPFRQVFALGQAQPSTSTQVVLYQGGSDVFQIVENQFQYVRLQTLDGSLNFWTTIDAISATPPPPAQYDYGVRGKTARLTGSSVFACAYNTRPTLAFGACQQLNNLTTATLVARITAESSILYVAEINNTQFVIPSNGVATIE